jgi:hypothetical protein
MPTLNQLVGRASSAQHRRAVIEIRTITRNFVNWVSVGGDPKKLLKKLKMHQLAIE